MKNKKITNYEYRMDFDIKNEYSNTGEKTGRIVLKPNAKRYVLRECNGTPGYFDKFDKLFIPLDELLNAMNQINSLPINMPPSRIENKKEYCEERFSNLGNYYSEAFKTDALESAKNLVFMSIDIVNSTRRSKNLDIETNTLTNLMFLIETEEIITRYEGNVVKFIGDGLIAYFTNPNITGKVDNSIECALTIKTFVEQYINKFLTERGISPLKFRIGINYGEGCIVNIDEKDDVYGHALDITHKIQEYADENQIIVGSRPNQLAHVYWREKLEKIDSDYVKDKNMELENIILYKLSVE